MTAICFNGMKKIPLWAKQIFIVVVLLFVASFISAVAAWTNPTAAPPNGNAPAPLNVGSNPQSKSAGLTFGSPSSFSLIRGILEVQHMVNLATIDGAVGIGNKNGEAPGDRHSSPASVALDVTSLDGLGNPTYKTITGLAKPIDPTDAVNKAYVDAEPVQQQFYMLKTIQQGNASAMDCGPGYVIIQCGSTGSSITSSLSSAKNNALDGYTGVNGNYNCGFDAYDSRSYVTAVPLSNSYYSAAIVLCMKNIPLVF